MVNDHTAFRVDWMPFGGAKTSGLGLGGIPDSMREMQNQKMMVIKSPVYKIIKFISNFHSKEFATLGIPKIYNFDQVGKIVFFTYKNNY